MPGGVMQLVAYGAQDLYLTGNPQITFFKLVYRRHTNFAMEYIPQFFYTRPNFQTDQKTEVKVQIQRNADLVYDTYLVYDLPNIRFPIEEFQNLKPEDVNFKWVRGLGHRIIDEVRVEIGGQLIDKQYGQWLNIWSELTTPDSKKDAYNRMTGNDYFKLRPGFSIYYPDKGTNTTIPSTRLYIPFEFWFCKNSGLALPLIALQYHEVYIHVVFNPLNDLFTLGADNLSPTAFFSAGNIANSVPDSFVRQLVARGFDNQNIFWEFLDGSWNQNTFLLLNYIYLDDDERRKFAFTTHEYLIHQTQRRVFTGLQEGPHRVELDMTQPVKEVIWAFQKDTVSDFNNWTNYTFLDLNNDYIQLKKEYSNKFDFLNQQADVAFMNSINNSFIVPSELNPSNSNCGFLGANISPTQGFNDYLNIMLWATLIFNGHERFEPRDNVFFNSVQSWKYHTHSAPAGVYIYSFALQPEQEQPSGTANFSRINKIEFAFYLRRDICETQNPQQDPVDEVNVAPTNPMNYNLYFYALNYNVLRIMGGLGGIAFQL